MSGFRACVPWHTLRRWSACASGVRARRGRRSCEVSEIGMTRVSAGEEGGGVGWVCVCVRGESQRVAAIVTALSPAAQVGERESETSCRLRDFTRRRRRRAPARSLFRFALQQYTGDSSMQATQPIHPVLSPRRPRTRRPLRGRTLAICANDPEPSQCLLLHANERARDPQTPVVRSSARSKSEAKRRRGGGGGGGKDSCGSSASCWLVILRVLRSSPACLSMLGGGHARGGVGFSPSLRKVFLLALLDLDPGPSFCSLWYEDRRSSVRTRRIRRFRFPRPPKRALTSPPPSSSSCSGSFSERDERR